MRHYKIIYVILLSFAMTPLDAQETQQRSDLPDSTRYSDMPDLTHVISASLPPLIFIPEDIYVPIHRLDRHTMLRPLFHAHPSFGFSGSIGFGEYEINFPDKFFSSFAGYNGINIPRLYVSQQMMVGNTLRIARGFYFMSGILYGSQLSIAGNNWGMGTREGFIWNPRETVSVIIWTQAFQSVSVYSPVMVPDINGNGAPIRMPATPEVVSFGVQASFVAGEFIIGIGVSVAPEPFQKRHHSEFRYR